MNIDGCFFLNYNDLQHRKKGFLLSLITINQKPTKTQLYRVK